MKRFHLAAVGIATAAATLLFANAPRSAPAAPSGTEAAMATAARTFLERLTPEKRSKAVFAFDADERLNWQFRRAERKGLPLKEMDAGQRKAAMELLRTGLSARGAEKAAIIRELERIPAVSENGRVAMQDPEKYFFSVFGEPSETARWGWRYEGHHCAVNWTVVPGKGVSGTPQFFGTLPAEVRESMPGVPPKGTRALAAEDDLGFEMVRSLTDAQRAQAITSPTSPTNIITGAARKVGIQEETGVAYAALTEAQQKILVSLIRAYTDNQASALAKQRLGAIRKAGIERVKFAWMGGIQPGQGHYYRIQGPTFLIEFDNTQSDANHIHSVWRDFDGDFGMDLLAMHYQAGRHRTLAAR
jgi:hypothetical protein